MQRLSVYKVQAPQRPVYSILKPLSAATTDDYDVTRSTPQPKPQDYRRDGKRCCSGRLPAAGDRPLLRQTIIRITYRSARPATRHHFFSNTVNQSVYPYLYKHLQLTITIPVSSSTSCDQCFGTMRGVKTWLRTTKVEDRLLVH
ncbi:zinc finger MYM-type protein 1-like [Aphis craccivora]|uniref:Zinc finger MYM-type protein 1-like n=1 Tax=Aphis craccivora TaxID=307492 RepID=A0A6G0YZZ9_APHCR|nr:zinc finger MYM-type protein 1-like [Aphis craccivora]